MLSRHVFTLRASTLLSSYASKTSHISLRLIRIHQSSTVLMETARQHSTLL